MQEVYVGHHSAFRGLRVREGAPLQAPHAKEERRDVEKTAMDVVDARAGERVQASSGRVSECKRGWRSELVVVETTAG